MPRMSLRLKNLTALRAKCAEAMVLSVHKANALISELISLDLIPRSFLYQFNNHDNHIHMYQGVLGFWG